MRALLIAAALIAPVPALAATGDVGCIEARLGPAAMQRIGDGAVAAADTGRNLASSLDADREALIAARDECKRANGWSADATDAAISYTQALALQPSAARALRSDGGNIDGAAAAYRALSPTDRRSFIGGMSPAARRAVDAVASSQSHRLTAKRHIVMLFSALSGVEFYPGEFVRS